MAKVTIKDVAERAGVSVKTVSRVINNEPNVRVAIQEKVHKAIGELGFKRNPLARGLRSNQSYTITMLYSNPNAGYILDLLNAALAQCQLDGYNLQLQPCDHSDPALIQSLTEQLKHSTQDGFLVTHPLSDNIEIRALLDKKGIPFTRISPFTNDHQSPHVGANDCQAAYEMTNYLISLGHKKIAFILGHPEFGATHQRYQGYQRALNEAGIKLDESLVKQGMFTFESGEKCARQLLNSGEKPTAIFASNDQMAAAVLKVAAQLKISIPFDLSVVGYDDAPVSQQIWPSLTTVKQPINDIGKHAVQKLIRAIKKQTFDDIQSQFNCHLIVRNSSGPAK